MTDPIFKKCTYCGYTWESLEDLLGDPAIRLIGYQVHFQDMKLGLFLFNHEECETTLMIKAEQFIDLYDGTVFKERLNDTGSCPDYCLYKHDFTPSEQPCECAAVRSLMQTLQTWKNDGEH